jgi:hypothetical protein
MSCAIGSLEKEEEKKKLMPIYKNLTLINIFKTLYSLKKYIFKNLELHATT